METMFIANTEIKHIETFIKTGTHVLSFTTPDSYATEDFDFGGLKAFIFCENVIKEVESVLRTVELFLGGVSDHPLIPFIGSHVPEYMEKANIHFLSEALEYTMEKREITEVEIDENMIQSGDFISIIRLDGLDPIVMWGTGSYAGHTTMALRFDGELYVIES